MSNKRSVRWLGLFGLLTSAALVGAGQVKLDGAKAPVGGSQEGAVVKTKTVGTFSTTPTTLSITNGTGQRQCIYITLTPPSKNTSSSHFPPSLEVSNLNQVILTCTVLGGIDEGIVHSCNTNDPGDLDKALQGFFYLNAGNTATYAPTLTLTFSANFYVNGNGGPNTDGSLPKNGTCITNGDVQGPGIGVTMAEVTLNVPTDDVTSAILGLEAVDISEVNGVNALWEIALPIPAGGNMATSPPPGVAPSPANGQYPCFFNTAFYDFPEPTSIPNWGNFGQGQSIPVPLIANDPGTAPTFSGDRNAKLLYNVGQGNVGVFPFGCDNCISRAKPGCDGATYPNFNLVQMPINICTVYRSHQWQVGGTVAIKLKQFPYPAQTIADHDVNTDGVTNSADLGHMLAAWGECSSTPCVGDLNNDGVVDQGDLGILLAHFVD